MPSSHRNYIPRPDDVDVARRYGFHRESAALEDPTIYYPLLSLLTSHLPLFETSSTKEQLSTIYDLIASSDLVQRHPMWDLSSFKTSLAMHEASPKVQAFYQYYDSVVAETELGRGIGGVCESWVEWRGKGFCGVDELKRDMELTLSSNARSAYPFPSPTPSKGITLILTLTIALPRVKPQRSYRSTTSTLKLTSHPRIPPRSSIHLTSRQPRPTSTNT